MAAGNNIVWINGHRWNDVTNETTALRAYTRKQVLSIGGDPRRVHEIDYVEGSHHVSNPSRRNT